MQILLAFFLIVLSKSFTYNRVFTTRGHTSLVTTAGFFNDGNRFISGSNDNLVKVWSLTNFTVLHQLTFADIITNVGLHPVDNRIFVLVYDGTINVYNPTTYALITSFNHPNWAANYIAFDTANNKFIIGGFDGFGVSPSVHYYNAATYAHLSSFVTGLPLDDQINTISLNGAGTHLAVINSALNSSITTYKLQIYRLSDNSLISSFTHPGKIRWAIFDNTVNKICTTCQDQSIRCFEYNSNSNVYTNIKTWNARGYPYCMNYGILGTMLVTIDSSLIFYTLLEGQSPPIIYLNLTDAQPIFVLDSNPNMSYLVTGQQFGTVSIWKYSASFTVTQETKVTTQANVGLIVGLSVGLTGFVTAVAILVYCCLCGGFAKWKKDKKNQDQSRHQIRSQLESNQRIIVIKDQNSDKSSNLEYDELMAQGTVIVIKDNQKKMKYLKGLIKKQKGIKTDDNQIKIQQNDFNNLRVDGNIIIIRDDDHPFKKGKKNQKNQINSQTQQDLDYEQLMAEGNVIIIKDEDCKKKLIKRLKQNGSDTSHLQVKDTIIIIKGDEQQKQYLKELQKQKQLKTIKHDKILANGDILVIQDKSKKKQFIEDVKKELQKNNNLNNKENDFKRLEVAEQIIVIRGDDDIDDEENYTYEQLMAQGTVIVIKDDDIIKQYAQFLNKNKKQNKSDQKKGGKSQKSSEPDYETLMAEECIIVIKEDNDRENYVKFMKYRKGKSQRSSNISYNELVNGNVMQIQEQNPKNKNEKRRNNSGGNLKPKNIQPNPIKVDPFKQLMAEKNVVVINEEGEVIDRNENLQQRSKSINMRK